MMRNEDYKQRFMDSPYMTSGKDGIQSFFKRAESYEELFDKDVKDFSRNEILDMCKQFNTHKIGVLNNMVSAFRIYTDWALSEGLVQDGQNHYREVEIKDLIEKCVNEQSLKKSILTREDVERIVFNLLNARDKFAVLAAFEFGIAHNCHDIVNLKLEDVQENGVHMSDGRVVAVSSLLKEEIVTAAKETTYTNVRGRTVSYVDDPEDHVFKFLRSVPETDKGKKAVIWRMTERLKSDYGEIFNLTTVYESGKLDMIFRRSKELKMKPADYFKSAYIKEVENQYGVGMHQNFYYKYKTILEEE